MTNILPSVIAKEPHLNVFDEMFDTRLSALDLSVLFIYMIDTVPAVALPHLAEQFHIQGYEGWKYASTEAEKRDLLKRAIFMHRYKGTRWSISEALKMLGFPGATFDEGIGLVLDGSWTLDGTYTLGSCFWAIFDTLIDATNYGSISPALVVDARNIINEWKPMRCRLRDVVFTYYFTINTTASAVANLLAYDLDGSKVLDGSWCLGNGLIELVQFGTSGASSASSITSPLSKAPVVTYPAYGQIQVTAELDSLEGNGITFQEFGLAEFTTGSLFNRQVQQPIQKDNTMRLRAVWTINYQ